MGQSSLLSLHNWGSRSVVHVHHCTGDRPMVMCAESSLSEWRVLLRAWNGHRLHDPEAGPHTTPWVAETKPLLSWAQAGLMDFVLRLPLSRFPWCKHRVLDFPQAWREEKIQPPPACRRLEGGSHKSNGCVCLKGTGVIFLAALFSAVIYISVMDKCRYFVDQSWTYRFRVEIKIDWAFCGFLTSTEKYPN